MAQKRMFDRAIVDTDRFMDLPMSAKAIYFLLGMEADDEGFVSPKKILRIHGGNEDDVKVLIAKNFLIPFDSGVVVITDWNTNNYLDKNRIRPTEYKKERSQLKLVLPDVQGRKTFNGYYTLTNHENNEFNNRLTTVKIEENRIEENRVEENTTKVEEKSSPVSPKKEFQLFGEFQKVKLTTQDHQRLVLELGEQPIENLIRELDEYLAARGKDPYKNHVAVLKTWFRRRVENHVKEVKNKNVVAF
jgi:hypothetical protein